LLFLTLAFPGKAIPQGVTVITCVHKFKNASYTFQKNCPVLLCLGLAGRCLACSSPTVLEGEMFEGKLMAIEF